MSSNWRPADLTVRSGPVILKNQSPLGASRIAPMRRHPGLAVGFAMPWAFGIMLPENVPLTSTNVARIPLLSTVVRLGLGSAG